MENTEKSPKNMLINKQKKYIKYIKITYYTCIYSTQDAHLHIYIYVCDDDCTKQKAEVELSL